LNGSYTDRPLPLRSVSLTTWPGAVRFFSQSSTGMVCPSTSSRVSSPWMPSAFMVTSCVTFFMGLLGGQGTARRPSGRRPGVAAGQRHLRRRGGEERGQRLPLLADQGGEPLVGERLLDVVREHRVARDDEPLGPGPVRGRGQGEPVDPPAVVLADDRSRPA